MNTERDLIPFYSSGKGTIYILLLLGLICLSCKPDHPESLSQITDPQQELLIKRREDGTLSSVNQINGRGWVHGLRVCYYSDGKTIFSRTTLDNGIKNGPFIRYYKNGQIFLYTAYKNGKKHGPARQYYKDGGLLTEFEYAHGNILPGLKEYQKDGTLIAGYPEISFDVEDHLERWNRVDLRIYSTPLNPGIKYYLKERSNGQESKIYLISENGSTLTQHYVAPGNTLQKKIEIIAEIPTELGNILVKHLSYDLRISNPY